MNAWIWAGSISFLLWTLSIAIYWAKHNPEFGFREQDLED